MSRKAAMCPVVYVTEVSSSVDVFIAAWVIQTDRPLFGGLSSHRTRTGALLSALLAGLSSPGLLLRMAHFTRIDILLPNQQVIRHATTVAPSPLLPLSARVGSFVSTFLALPHRPHLAWRLFRPNWAHARHVRDFVCGLLDDPLPGLDDAVPPDRKEEMHREWAASYSPSARSSHKTCRPPDGNRPPPFIRGALSRGNRRLFSAAVQLATGHAFTANYSLRFRAGADDNT